MIKARRAFPLLVGVIAVVLIGFGPASDAETFSIQRARTGRVCGDPTVRCVTSVEFQPNDMPFQIPKSGVIWESEKFYAVILKSLNAKDNCTTFVSEDERLEAQALFPHNKVFSDRCAEPGNLFYTNTNSNARFMAVYAGKSRAEAERMRARVAATGKYPGANVRRTSMGFNGT
jgi:hypothetical protein